MIAFDGDPAIKAKYLARVEAHRKADEIVQGYGYWKDGKGCAIGCTLHGGRHQDYEIELGIPRALAHLEDGLFESMPVEAARRWPTRFLSSIRVGADLESAMVVQRFVHWLLTDSIGVTDHEPTNYILRECADLYRRWIDGDQPTGGEVESLAFFVDLAARADLAARVARSARSALGDLAARVARSALGDRADLAALADLADLADRADLAEKHADKLIEILEAA